MQSVLIYFIFIFNSILIFKLGTRFDGYTSMFCLRILFLPRDKISHQTKPIQILTDNLVLQRPSAVVTMAGAHSYSVWRCLGLH